MSSPQNVPYQAYKSKRHSRTVSNQHMVPNVSPPPLSRPNSTVNNGSANPPSQPRAGTPEPERSAPAVESVEWKPSSMPATGNGILNGVEHGGFTHRSSASVGGAPSQGVPTNQAPSQDEQLAAKKSTVAVTNQAPDPASIPAPTSPPVQTRTMSPTNSPVLTNGTPEPIAGPSSSTSNSPAKTTSATTSSVPVTPTPLTRKSSSFRHIPLRNSVARSPLPSSPLRPPGAGTHSRTVSTSSIASAHRQFEQPVPYRPAQPRSRMSSLTSVRSAASESTFGSPTQDNKSLPTIPAVETERETAGYSERATASPSPSQPLISQETIIPPPRTHSLMAGSSSALPPKAHSRSQSQAPSPASTPAITPSTSLPLAPQAPVRVPAPYRPGFQPKGVYRPLTDEFALARSAHLDVGRIERTKLERRFEKLIQLHFSSDAEREKARQRPGMGVSGDNRNSRRASSFFDLDFSELSLKSLDAGELWRGVLQSQVAQGSKADIRAAEQRITPWQDDASVSKCPLCTASFHPLTNRKHHCRLCGQIICSLPAKRPQRPVTCSLLFVVDPKTRRIEEVGEGVDYGVRKRRNSTAGAVKGKEKGGDEMVEEEKFLKGVRICRDCRPVLLRQQYHYEVIHVPTFARLYEVFINLEKEIEDSLPQFQELILSLNNDDQPTKEASAARKRLLEAFAQYDGLSKRIRKIPCPGGKGSSQDRVQMAILSRANLFLQKNMFPLQSLPTTKPKTAKSPSPDDGPVIDPDSAAAHALQPLLEQEALLESFVEEAKAHRKFEDAKILKANLQEIRAEIDRVMANADGPMGQSKGKANKSQR